MLAAYAARVDADDPLSALEVGERPEPAAPDGWATVSVRAASLNHHDVWALRGVALSADQTPMILGGDAAGVDEDGNEVVVHSVIGDPDAGAETRPTIRGAACCRRSTTGRSPSRSSYRDATCCPSPRSCRSRRPRACRRRGSRRT